MDFVRFRVTHNDHDVPYGLIYKALKQIQSNESAGQDVVEFHNVVGYSNLVEVDDSDEFYEEVRGSRPYASRFVKNKLPVPCTKLAVIWNRKDAEFINVITAYFTDQDTPYCPDEPGNILRKMGRGDKYTPHQLEEAYAFWSKHAFVEPIPLNYQK